MVMWNCVQGVGSGSRSHCLKFTGQESVPERWTEVQMKMQVIKLFLWKDSPFFPTMTFLCRWLLRFFYICFTFEPWLGVDGCFQRVKGVPCGRAIQLSCRCCLLVLTATCCAWESCLLPGCIQKRDACLKWGFPVHPPCAGLIKELLSCGSFALEGFINFQMFQLRNFRALSVRLGWPTQPRVSLDSQVQMSLLVRAL